MLTRKKRSNRGLRDTTGRQREKKVRDLASCRAFGWTDGANAALVSWLFSGNLTVAGGSDLPSTIHVGDPFSAILHFDTSTPANIGGNNLATCFPNNGGPNSICHFNGAPFSSQYWSDVTVDGINYGMVPSFANINSVTVRNDAPDPQSPADTIDGYAFETELMFRSMRRR